MFREAARLEMAPKTFLIALLFVTSLNFTYLQAQDGPCRRRTVAVDVVDDQWNFAQGLSAANFRGKLHGHDVEILSASIDTRPRHIVMLLDASGSMMDPGEGWRTAKTISEYLIRFAPPRASIAQMGFSETVLDTEGFEQEPLALVKRLDALVKACERERKTLRKTALYDAIASARGALGVANVGDVICALTDAGDNTSRTKPRRVEDDLLKAGIRLFAVIVASNPWTRSQTPEEIEGPNQLHSVVRATGGNVLVVPYGAGLGQVPLDYIKAKTIGDRIDLAVQRLYQQMGEFYRVELRLPEAVDKPTKWNLEVIGANGKPDRRVEVHYPQQLMPCDKASP
jgi:hypothetical protein